MSTSTTTRPLIDFSGSRYATARAYAEDLKSRIHKPETNATLQAIVEGREVDAYTLADILGDVFSGAATRGAQSPQRRRHTKMARHLHHIAHAVIQNHADGLPAYAEGDRSRAVANLTEQLDAMTAERDSLTSLHDSVAESLESALAEVERVAQALRDEVAAHANTRQVVLAARDEIATLTAGQDVLQDEVSKLSAVLGYTRGLGTAEQAAQSLGYQHGLERR